MLKVLRKMATNSRLSSTMSQSGKIHITTARHSHTVTSVHQHSTAAHLGQGSGDIAWVGAKLLWYAEEKKRKEKKKKKKNKKRKRQPRCMPLPSLDRKVLPAYFLAFHWQTDTDTDTSSCSRALTTICHIPGVALTRKKLRFLRKKRAGYANLKMLYVYCTLKTVTSHIKMRLVFSFFTPSREGL